MSATGMHRTDELSGKPERVSAEVGAAAERVVKAEGHDWSPEVRAAANQHLRC